MPQSITSQVKNGRAYLAGRANSRGNPEPVREGYHLWFIVSRTIAANLKLFRQ